MAEDAKPVRVDQIDWRALFPVLNLLRTFGVAIHPYRLLVALLLMLGLMLYGLLLNWLWIQTGEPVYPGEVAAHRELDRDAFARWRAERPATIAREVEDLLSDRAIDYEPAEDASVAERVDAGMSAVAAYYDGELQQLSFDDQLRELEARRDRGELDAEAFEAQRKALRQRRDAGELSVSVPTGVHARLAEARGRRLAALRALRPTGVFYAALDFKLNALCRLSVALLTLDTGVADLAPGGTFSADSGTAGALYDLCVTLPCWLWHTHACFFVLWLVGAWALVALLGGALCRMAAMHVGRDERISLRSALSFALGKWLWLFLTPIIPLIVLLLIAFVMALVGMVFNLPVLDVIGGLLFGLALFGGLVAAVIVVGLVAGMNLFAPAIATEGSDAFDAISRAYSYVLFRPWRLLGYTFTSLVYGAATGLFVTGMLALTLLLAHGFAGEWVWAGGSDWAATRFDQIVPLAGTAALSYEADLSSLDASGRIAAVLIRGWIYILLCTLGAYGLSYWFCAQTWIYLLLRRVADGNEYDDVYVEADPEVGIAAPAPDKVEPPDGGAAATPTA